MYLAGDFASSPSGYVIAFLVTVALALIGVIWRSQVNTNEQNAQQNAQLTRRIDTIAESLNTTNRSLDVLISRDNDERPLVSRHTDAIAKLTETTAVLNDRLERHERWAQSEHDRIRSGAAPTS